MEKRKIGLVIQGALMSVGRAGNRLHDTPEQLMKDGGIIHYDCRDNINKLIQEYGYLFDEIVVSVFDNQLQPGDNFPGATLVSAPDPGTIKQEGHYKDNNKHRQFISTLNGLKELEKSGIDYAVKIRTDQYLDVKTLVESFLSGIETNPNPRAIYATVVHPPTFLLHDLYFAATVVALKEFCESVIAYDLFEFASSVHREMVLKHAHAQYRQAINVPEWAYFPMFPPGGVNASTRRIFDYMFKNVFFSLPQEIFRSTLWRGAHYEKEHIDGLVETKVKHRKYNIPALISTDWQRYFHFRREIYGKKIIFTDEVVAQAGKLGWDLWSFTRKTARSIISK